MSRLIAYPPRASRARACVRARRRAGIDRMGPVGGPASGPCSGSSRSSPNSNSPGGPDCSARSEAASRPRRSRQRTLLQLARSSSLNRTVRNGSTLPVLRETGSERSVSRPSPARPDPGIASAGWESVSRSRRWRPHRWQREGPPARQAKAAGQRHRTPTARRAPTPRVGSAISVRGKRSDAFSLRPSDGI